MGTCITMTHQKFYFYFEVFNQLEFPKDYLLRCVLFSLGDGRRCVNKYFGGETTMGPMTKAKKKHYNLVASEMNAITNSFMNDIVKQAPKKKIFNSILSIC